MIANPQNKLNKEFILFWSIIILYFLWNLGGYDLTAPDEPRFALVAREAIENNHWFLIHRNGYAYPDKPPLFFWMIAFFSLIAGEVNAWTARLPSAIAAIVSLIAIYRFVKTEVNYRSAIYAVSIVSSTVIFFYQARMAQIDMFLCAFVVCSIIALFNAVHDKFQKAWVIGLLFGLGTLAKGPVAILIPLGSIVTYCLINKISLKKIPWRLFSTCIIVILTWLLFLVLAAKSQNNFAYLENILFKQTIVRYANAWHHHKPFYYFLTTIWLDGLPWVFIFILAIPLNRESFKSLSGVQKLCLSVFFFTLLFFSLSKGKRNLYILPIYPFMGIYVSIFLDQFLEKKLYEKLFTIINKIFFVVFLLVALALISLKFLAPKFSKYAEYASSFPFISVALFGIVIIVISIFWIQALKDQKYSTAYNYLISSFLVISLMLFSLIMPWLNQYRSVRHFMSESIAIMKKYDPDYQIGMVDFRSEFRFYGDKNIIELNDASGESKNGEYGLPEFWTKYPNAWAIIREQDLEEYNQKLKSPIQANMIYKEDLGKNKTYCLLHLKYRLF